MIAVGTRVLFTDCGTGLEPHNGQIGTITQGGDIRFDDGLSIWYNPDEVTAL